MSTDWGLGDAGRPRHFCRACERVEYTPKPWECRAAFPPDVSARRMKKGCPKKPGCDIEYRAGVGASLRQLIDHAKEKSS